MKIKLDKEREIRLNLNAMVRFEEVTGINLLKQAAMQDLSMKDVRALLWACLVHEDPNLTLEQVGEMVHTGNFAEVAEKLGKVWEAAIPADDVSPLPG